MTALGLDYGTRYLGVALAQSSLAQPLTTLSTPTALPRLLQLINEYQVDHLIIGKSDPRLEPAIATFIQSLQPTSLPIIRVDETLTSHDAHQALLHTSRSRRHHLNHAASAALILQSWLDQPHLAI